MLSRRSFLAATGSSLMLQTLYPLRTGAAEPVPSILDHILLGCSDLDRGIRKRQRPGSCATADDRTRTLSLGTAAHLTAGGPNPR